MNRFFPYLFFLVSFSSFAQHELTARLIDEKNESLPYLNSILYKMPDSTFYQGTSSDDLGKVLFKNIEDGEYTMVVTGVGYVTLSRKLTINSNQNLGDLIVQEQIESMDAVTVTAKRPTVTKKADRLIFNVENTSLSNTDALTILRSSPGVFKQNNTYIVKGQAAQIYINNKRVYLTDDELNQLLAGYSGDNVKNVEVITNPPASYDAEGGTVININTSKGISLGYKGNVMGSYTIDELAKYKIGTSHFYKNNWVNIYANYSYNPREDLYIEENEIGFFNPDGTRSQRWFTDYNNVNESDAHSLNTVIDFSLSGKSYLSVSGNINVNNNQDGDAFTRTLILQDGDTDFSGLETNGLNERDATTGFVNADYNYYADNGNVLRLYGNHVFTNKDNYQDVFTRFFDTQNNTTGSNSFLSDIDLDVAIYTAGIDYQFALGEYQLSTGAKYNQIDSQTVQDFFDSNGTSPIIVPANSDNYAYDEKIIAFYGQMERNWEKWFLTAGLRAEQTDITGDSRSLGIVNTQNYLSWFPTASLGHSLDESNTLTLSYKRSIERPRYESLNPYRIFVNETNFNSGNPNLMPSFNNKYSVAWNHNDTWFFDAYYLYSKDLLSILPFQDNNANSLNFQNANLNYELQYSLDIETFQYPTDSWLLALSASFFYLENEFVAVQSGGVDQKQDVTGVYLSSFSRFSLSEDRTWSLDAELNYVSDILFGSFRMQNMIVSNFAINKSLWNRRANLRIAYNDVFRGQNRLMESIYRNQDVGVTYLPETNTFSVAFTYNFGNYGLRNNEVEEPEEKERTQQQSLGL